MLESTPDHVFGRDDVPQVMVYTAKLMKSMSHECEMGWHQMVMFGDHQRIVDKLRAQGLSQEDREGLKRVIQVLDRVRACSQGPCSKCERGVDASRKTIAAILRRLGGQTT